VQFIVERAEGDIEGRFQGLGTTRSNDIVNRALEDLEDPKVRMGPVAARLRAVAMRDPDCLEAFATLGWLYAARGMHQTAREWYELAVRHALKVIPKSFAGKIRWDYLDNRPFLRCHHGLACTFMYLGDWPACIALLEKHLAWNADDNQGVRWLIGDAYVQVSRYDEAARHLSRVKDEYPPARYSLAWIYFNQDRYAEALTELRFGFLENIYIAELIAGAYYPRKHFYWHGTNLAEPDLAREHYERFVSHKWGAAEKEFVVWALDCASALAERAEFRRYQEELSHERDLSKRSAGLARINTIRAGVHVQSSASWIRRVKNRKGVEHWIWEKEAYE